MHVNELASIQPPTQSNETMNILEYEIHVNDAYPLEERSKFETQRAAHASPHHDHTP